MKAAVVVLGDLGHSPRMSYHCISLSKLENTTVDFVGYKGSECRKAILDNPNIQLRYLNQPEMPTFVKRSFLLRSVFKVLYQIYILFYSFLITLPKYDVILCQTPPFIPIVPVLLIVCLLRGSKLIIDWHNLGYTLLPSKKTFINNLARFIYKNCEFLFGKYSHGNLCVTDAMKQYLQKTSSIESHVLKDKPPSFFHRCTLLEQHKLFMEIQPLIEHINFTKKKEKEIGEEVTLFTYKEYISGNIKYREDRPILLVSSTSWTEDEDFGILLDAFIKYDKKKDSKNLVAIITGKGPLKEYYLNKINEIKMNKVKIVTMWLTAEQYPLLLGSADIGISMHTSSSGLDLPMKVVDMFGTNLPVLSVNFQCLNELVKHNENGLVFNTSDQCCDQLLKIFINFPNDTTKINKMRNNINTFLQDRWEDNWDCTMKPMLSKLL